MAKKTPDNTEQHKKAFLAAYSVSGNVSHACEIAKISRQTHYRWLQEDEQYAKDYESAFEIATDALEAEARRRAMEGSDTLLIFLLKGMRPAVYKERIANEHSGPNGKPIQLEAGYNLSALSDEELRQLEQILTKTALPAGSEG